MGSKLKVVSACGLALMLLAGCGAKSSETNSSHSSSQASSTNVTKKHSTSSKEAKSKGSSSISSSSSASSLEAVKTEAKSSEKIKRSESSSSSTKASGSSSEKPKDKSSDKKEIQKTTKKATETKSLLMPDLQGTWYHYNTAKDPFYGGKEGWYTIKIEGNKITDTTSFDAMVETVTNATSENTLQEYKEYNDSHPDSKYIGTVKKTSFYGLPEEVTAPIGYAGSARTGYSVPTLNIDGKQVKVLALQSITDSMYQTVAPSPIPHPTLFYPNKELAMKQKDNSNFPIFKHPKVQ